jgi:dipeptidyl aminopeptidase/acylaminoacyl peptidase
MQMKNIILLFSLFLTNSLIAQESKYIGELTYGNSFLNIQLELIEKENQTTLFFSSLEMNAYNIPALNVVNTNDSLIFYIVSDYYTYEYTYKKKNKNLAGLLKIYSNESDKLLNTFSTNLLKQVNNNQDVDKEEFSFISNGINLKGSFWKPKKANGICLFFVSSSQGSDRNATSAEAIYFAKKGFTVFHYDKRGTGKSEGNWKIATIEELASDDINAIAEVSKKLKIPFSKVGIKGSSQGGIKIPYILSKLPELKFGVSVSCPSGTLLESDLNYWKNLNTNKIGEKNIELATKVLKASFDYSAKNISYEDLQTIVAPYQKTDWIKHIWIPEKNINLETTQIPSNFSGLPYFKVIKNPILVIQGDADIVIPEKSYQIIGTSLKSSGNKKYKIILIKNATHSMTVVDKNYPYFQKLAPNYLNEVEKWIESIK